MKKISLLIAIIIMLTSAFPVFTSAEETTTGGYIALADTNDARLVAAGDTLAKYMKQITGKEFPVNTDGEGLKFTLGYSSNKRKRSVNPRLRNKRCHSRCLRIS